MINKDKLTHNL